MNVLNGWKVIIGYVTTTLLQLGQGEAPMLAAAIEKAGAQASLPAILEAIAQILLFIGVVHRAKKNVQGE